MISAHCDTRNIASKKLMEKLGFNYLGISERIYPDDRSPAFEHSYELVLGE
jgi:RimJ/RimL family protein N-acetyltransferase